MEEMVLSRNSEPVAVDLLLLNGLVLTLDDQDQRFDPGGVAVRNGEIVAVGAGEAVQSAFHASRTLDVGGCVVMPGLINAHTHAAMTIFRGLADDLPLMDWLHQHIFPAERKLTEEWVYWGTLLACAEMILSGTTTFCDMYLFEHKVAEAAKAAGMRALVGEVLYDFPSPNYGPIESGLEFTESLINEWQGDPLVRIAVEPHAPYTCSPSVLQRCAELAERCDVPLIMHVSENEAEVEEILKRYGRRPVAHLESLGMLSPRLIADHCVALDDQDMALLARRGVEVVHNPESNMKLASGIAPVPRLLEMGVNVALGTDGCASNNDLDLFGEMDTCAKLQRWRPWTRRCSPPERCSAWPPATAPRRSGWEGKIGELSPANGRTSSWWTLISLT